MYFPSGEHLATSLPGSPGSDDGSLNLGINLFESLGGNVFVESAENGFTLVGSEVFDDVRDIGGMELGQAVVRNF